MSRAIPVADATKTDSHDFRFELERLIDNLHEQSYLHGTITQDPKSREWRIDPGALIHSQKALPLNRDS